MKAPIHPMAGVLVKAGVAALGLTWALGAPAVLAGDAMSYVKAGSRAADLRACVEPTSYMRRHHMDLIQHQRDATVHQGIRGTRHSLAGCIDCHVSLGADAAPVAVNAEHQFCRSCHEFAAVTVNCFDCHDGVPKGGSMSEAAHPAVAERSAAHVPETGPAEAARAGKGR